jgi:hypothetical protein
VVRKHGLVPSDEAEAARIWLNRNKNADNCVFTTSPDSGCRFGRAFSSLPAPPAMIGEPLGKAIKQKRYMTHP